VIVAVQDSAVPEGHKRIAGRCSEERAEPPEFDEHPLRPEGGVRMIVANEKLTMRRCSGLFLA
jgi:hypothetical protein